MADMEIMKLSDPIVLSGSINDFCQNFFDASGIKTFGYIEIDENGDYLELESNSQIFEDILASKLNGSMSEYILKDTPNCGFSLTDLKQKSQPCVISQLKDKYQLGHGLSYVDTISNSGIGTAKIRHFYFSSAKQKSSINDFYINNSDSIKRFCFDFYNRFEHSISKLNRMSLDNNCLDSFTSLHQVFTKKTSFDFLNTRVFSFNDLPFNLDKALFLTEKEKEIVYLYYYQFSYAEIADKLDISRRTVDRHFDNIRRKLNCKTSGHIIAALLAL